MTGMMSTAVAAARPITRAQTIMSVVSSPVADVIGNHAR